ncbi:MAG: hypothetical protein EXR65_04955 [Dehalococcoidia bacterium]|nr:hypothetical protein [Dehalococcoidia bacterium]
MGSEVEWLPAALRTVHVLTAVLMAWPAYALVAVNQRARMGPPLGDRVDLYLEEMVKGRAIPCFIFQATALVTGVWLAAERGLDGSAFAENWRLMAKLVLLVFISGVLLYVYVWLQPRIDAEFAQLARGPDPAVAARIGALRLRRKRLASVCMFGVLVMVMLGMQVWTAFPACLTLAALALIALFCWRTYRTGTAFGWV